VEDLQMLNAQDQSVYKMLKYFAKERYYVAEDTPNNFSSSFNIRLDVPGFNDAYHGNKRIHIGFNTRTAWWSLNSYDYERGMDVKTTGTLHWDTIIPLMEEVLMENMTQDIERKFLRAEEERTKKVRNLRVRCLLKRQLEAIAELATHE
jgi:hypothetical protein